MKVDFSLPQLSQTLRHVRQLSVKYSFLLSLVLTGLLWHSSAQALDTFNEVEQPQPAWTLNSNTCPTLADLDGDGDIDALVGMVGGRSNDNDEKLFYLKNTGDNPPIFETKSAAELFVKAPEGLINIAPTLADMDNDGDVDLLLGTPTTVQYFENIGTTSNPVFAEDFTLISLPVTSGPTIPSLGGSPGEPISIVVHPMPVDLDNDNDQDLVLVRTIRKPFRFSLVYFVIAQVFDRTELLYFENTGSVKVPDYAQIEASDNPFQHVNQGKYGEPFVSEHLIQGPFSGQGLISIDRHEIATFADLDGDDDFDMLIGDRYGAFHYFENVGTSAIPTFEEQLPTFPANASTDTFISPPGEAVEVNDTLMIPNADKLYVAVTGETFARFSRPPFLIGDGGFIRFSDATGEILGSFYGLIRHTFQVPGDTVELYLKSSGPAVAATVSDQAPLSNNPLLGVDIFSNAAPAFADFDGDSDLDILAGTGQGGLHYFENIGTVTSAKYLKKTFNILEFPGYAVLIQGRTASGENLATHQAILQQLYQTLIDQGFAPENIYCHGWDASNHNCSLVPDGVVSPMELRTRLNQQPKPLYIIPIGAGDELGNFPIDNGNGAALTADIMNGWLTEIDTRLNTSALAAPRYLILGYEQSAKTLPKLSVPQWRVLTGTASTSLDLFEALQNASPLSCVESHNNGCKPSFFAANHQLLLGQVNILNLPGTEALTVQLTRQQDGSFILTHVENGATNQPNDPVFDAATGLLTIPELDVLTNTLQRVQNVQLMLLPDPAVYRFQFAAGSPMF